MGGRASKRAKREKQSSSSNEENENENEEEEEEEQEEEEPDFATWSSDRILNYWIRHPPSTSDTFPAPPHGRSFMGSTTGQGRW